MALLQIAEPEAAPAERRPRAVCGIDLGTTHSLVALARGGAAATLPDADGRHRLPSVVRYREDGGALVGAAALAGDPDGAVFSVKRLMGRGAGDADAARYRLEEGADAVPRLRTAAGPRTAMEVSAEILRALRARAEAALGAPLEGVVLTVPAYFDDAQRQATKDAARLAGLRVLRLLNEPTAAALAYGLDRGADGERVAVFDLGGGTFDLSVLRLSRGVFEVRATGGDTALGGDDFDQAVLEWALREAGLAAPDRAGARRLLLAARRARESLTAAAAAELELPDGGALALSRERLEELSRPLLARILDRCRRTLRDAGAAPGEIDQVVLVGGMTRMPLLRREVAGLFGRAPCGGIHPDRVVAAGAALQAAALAGGGDDLLLLDVLPLSLGIEIMGGLSEKIIPRNTTVPARHVQEFTTFRDGQTALAVHVVQGERELVSDCRSLARFELRGIPPRAAGAARIRVEFQVDADGLLTVEAAEAESGARAGVAVKPSYGLGEEEIERMLRDSLAHVEEDAAARTLREQRVEADRAAAALREALARDGELLPAGAERARVEQALAALERARDGEDADAVRAAARELEAASEGFVERRMNRSIRQAMRGRRPEEFREGTEP